MTELKDKNLYYVGGVVRDEILGTLSIDTDFCYEGNAIEFAKNLNIIKENPDFGTVRVLFNDKEIDIASTREEFYPKAGHLPEVTNIGCPLKKDLKRRDFTINAIAKNTVSGEIVDYFNGLEDIKNKKIRVLHEKSFIDDPTRIIRALKFSVRFNFELEENTKKLQDEYLENINYDISFHRIKKELKETFNLNKEIAFQQFIAQGIYKLLGKNQTIPTLKGSIENIINKYNPIYPWIIYMGLFDLSNFELTTQEKEIIKSVPASCPEDEFEAYKLFSSIPRESVMLFALKNNYKKGCEFLSKNIKIEINGKDLAALGIPQGQIYREIFDYILRIKLSKNLTKEEELNIVKEKFL